MSHSGRIGGVRAVWRVQIRAKRVVRRRMSDEKEASWDDARNMSHSGRNGGVRCVWRDWCVPVRAKRVVRRRMGDEMESSWDDISWENI